MSENGERVPLLRDGSATPVSEYEGSSSAKHAVGPLDIAPSNRRAILLGVWCAVFLSVSRYICAGADPYLIVTKSVNSTISDFLRVE